MKSFYIETGDRVIVDGEKLGTLRFCGTTKFAAGLWAGVELDKDMGKNNGSVNGVKYFNCPKNKGIFIPAGRVTKVRIFLFSSEENFELFLNKFYFRSAKTIVKVALLLNLMS